MKNLVLSMCACFLFLLTGCTTIDYSSYDLGPGKDAFAPERESSESFVPLPTGEDIVNTFFELINEHRIPEAISMMSSKAVPNDSAKETWGVQFNDISSIEAPSIKPYDEGHWILNQKVYKVELKVTVKPDPDKSPVPHYGWEDGTNIRWVKLSKSSSLWKIDGISTGP